MSSNECGRSVRRCLLTRARPVPETTKSHCSEWGCSFCGSPVDLPGGSTISPAWTERVLARILKNGCIFPVLMCFIEIRSFQLGRPRHRDERRSDIQVGIILLRRSLDGP